MCRIFGYIGEEKITKTILSEVSKLQIHGGPDAQNFIQRDRWALGNNRLAIQGISGGEQPYTITNKISVVFNGEIYNHNALRKMLEQRGYFFKDTCDGSILPALYHEYEEDFVKLLDGMFAIAIIDERNGLKLVLASDPTGIKSLYYYWNNEYKTLKFSSELAPLLALGKISKEIRLQGVDEYLTGKAIWGPQTIYKNIFSLNPSSILIAPLGKPPTIFNYVSSINPDFQYDDIDEAGLALNKLIENEVATLMTADVPVCVVTSGGLDSSYISALASKFDSNLHSFNIWYEGDWPQDERHFAKEVADHNNTNHHQLIIKQRCFPDIVRKMVKHIGQPNSAPHCLSTFVLFEEVRAAGFKVALTGEGADEFFGGYARFAMAASDTNRNWLPTYLDKLSAMNKTQRDDIYTSDYQQYIRSNDDLYNKTIDTILRRENNSKDRLNTLLEFDQIARFPYYILRRVDHLSMAHSVEVRVPFCQPRIAAISKKIPNNFKISNNQGKIILYKAAKDKLPQSILTRPKQPFLLPISSMLKKGHILYNLLLDTLHSHKFQSRNIFRKDSVEKLLQKHIKNPSDTHAEALWSMMILELWLDATDNILAA
ncbi:MAG: asparagine synthase (glutamine-hydrolyzing) [Gammaproteobacteria bacterium]|nr:asparagine synthase (glutamine-hydrolyzing) [Gammaproteobacteria bacterium]